MAKGKGIENIINKQAQEGFLQKLKKKISRKAITYGLAFSLLSPFLYSNRPLHASEESESQSDNSSKWEFFPTERGFENLIADPGEVKFGVVTYKEKKSKYVGFDGYIGHIVKLAELTKYDVFPEKGVNKAEYRLSVGLGGCVIASGEWKKGKYLLRTVDLFGTLPIDFRKGPFFGRFQFSHISSHLTEMAQREAIAYSRDYAKILFSYDVINDVVNLRPYAGISFLLYGHPKPSSPVSLQWGIELETPPLMRGLFNPYAAFDFQRRGDFNHSCDFGLEIGTKLTAKKNSRVALIYYKGNDRRGQFYNEKRTLLGTCLFIDF